MVPGAQPVFVCPYRYPPNLKDEIERQVQEMFDQGIIQPSNSAFSSPVMLVKRRMDPTDFVWISVNSMH